MHTKISKGDREVTYAKRCCSLGNFSPVRNKFPLEIDLTSRCYELGTQNRSGSYLVHNQTTDNSFTHSFTSCNSQEAEKFLKYKVGTYTLQKFH